MESAPNRRVGRAGRVEADLGRKRKNLVASGELPDLLALLLLELGPDTAGLTNGDDD